MGNFRILKSARPVLVSLLLAAVSPLVSSSAAALAPDSGFLVRDLVASSLLRGLSATEITPVPATSPACLLVAGVLGSEGTPTVGPTARLLTVTGDIGQDTLRELSVKLGGSGLKVGQQLVMLTSDLEWVNQGAGLVLTLGVDRGAFQGFWRGAPHLRELVKVARVGDELCVAAG